MDDQGSPGNGKALVSLVLGAIALANVIVLAGFIVIDINALDRNGAWWLLLPFFGFAAGTIAAFLGALGWIDVRRGVTHRRLREAQAGAILGGIAVGLLVISGIVLFAFFIFLMTVFGADG